MEHPRVVHLVPHLFGDGGVYGGAERYAWELSRAMAKRVPARLVGFGKPPEPGTRHERIDSLSVYRLRNWLPGPRFEPSPAGPGLLRHLRWADVIHCHQTHTMGADLAVLCASWMRKPIFGTDHGGGGFCLRNGVGFSARLSVSLFSQSLGPRNTGFDQVIWGGVDERRFHPGDGIERGGKALFVGRLLPHKGIDVLVRAAALAQTRVLVLGRPVAPGYFRRLRQLAEELGAPAEFLTDCGDAGLVGHYQRAMCVVLPSVYENEEGSYPVAELLGQTLLEGMACGCPVIATRVGGMPEVVEEGVTGFLVPPNDPAALAAKISWFRDHPVRARQMGDAARARVLAMFTWEAVVERCLAAYQSLGRNDAD